MKFSALIMIILLSVGCGDDSKKSASNPNNVSNNSTNNSTNNTTNNSSNNGTNSINISDYDQTCEFDGDCVLVNPDPCGCGCDYNGINTDDRRAYIDAIGQLGCSTGMVCNTACEELASCWQGICQPRLPQIVKAEDYDNSCETADDCMYVATGEVCESCQCPATPVNRADYEANPPAAAECTPGPSVCDCASPPEIACNNGTCGFAE